MFRRLFDSAYLFRLALYPKEGLDGGAETFSHLSAKGMGPGGGGGGGLCHQ